MSIYLASARGSAAGKMGAHPDTQNRTRGWRFCVWAPDVKSVHVIGEFNDWDEEANPLVPVHTSAIWGRLYSWRRTRSAL